MAMFAALENSVTQITSYSGGIVLQEDKKSREYDSAHYVTYATQEDIDIYFHHEAHQAFIEANKAHWEQVLVVDSEVIAK